MTKYLLIGDIHGCHAELAELLDSCGEPDRQVVSLGDVVDRGPESGKCVELLRARGAWVVLGNHEEKHFRYRRRLREGTAHEMRMARHHLLAQAQVPGDDWRWLEETCVPFVRIPEHRIIALHAGVHAGVSPEDMRPDRICRVQTTRPGETGKSPWGNWAIVDGEPCLVGKTWEEARAKGYSWWTEHLDDDDWTYVYGHTVFKRPMATYRSNDEQESWVHEFIDIDHDLSLGIIPPQAIGIDTGAPFGGSLTGLLLPEWRLVSIPAREIYFGKRELDPDYSGDTGGEL